ncbi:hypothetical protein EH220_02970 [bacterium]|nr:MAG: hypothetical protein EH220_02970 [bacterium]
MKPLGPIASYQDAGADPYYTLYVDFTDRLVTDEVIVTASVLTDVSGILIAESQGTTEDLENEEDGSVVEAGQAVQFNVTVQSRMRRTVPLTVKIVTDLNHVDVVWTDLVVKWKVR